MKNVMSAGEDKVNRGGKQQGDMAGKLGDGIGGSLTLGGTHNT
jgi:hypothetical protein